MFLSFRNLELIVFTYFFFEYFTRNKIKITENCNDMQYVIEF